MNREIEALLERAHTYSVRAQRRRRIARRAWFAAGVVSGLTVRHIAVVARALHH